MFKNKKILKKIKRLKRKRKKMILYWQNSKVIKMKTKVQRVKTI